MLNAAYTTIPQYAIAFGDVFARFFCYAYYPNKRSVPYDNLRLYS